MREDERLDQSGGGGGGEMWSDSGYSWKVNSTGFADRLDEQHERKGEFKDVFYVGNWKDGVAIYEMQKTMGEWDLEFYQVEDGNQEFRLGLTKFEVATKTSK